MSDFWKSVRLGMVVSALALPAVAQETTKTATASFVDNSGTVIGEATLVDTKVGVLIRLALDNVPPGWHAIHIHEIGKCDDHESLKNSGGHVNVAERAHGLLNPDGPDNADLPNVYAHGDGTLRVEVLTPLVSLDGQDRPAILDDNGSALVMHTNPDDHVTQPIGGAGARIACGVIKATE